MRNWLNPLLRGISRLDGESRETCFWAITLVGDGRDGDEEKVVNKLRGGGVIAIPEHEGEDERMTALEFAMLTVRRMRQENGDVSFACGSLSS